MAKVFVYFSEPQEVVFELLCVMESHGLDRGGQPVFPIDLGKKNSLCFHNDPNSK